MPQIDYEWVKQQLTRSATRKPVGDAVMALLKLWETQSLPREEFEAEVIDTFSSLAHGHAIVKDAEFRWIPIQIGAHVEVGETVRVRLDAFEGEPGRIHNGRIGVVVAKRYGDIIVKHTDGLPATRVEPRYPPNVLEKRV